MVLSVKDVSFTYPSRAEKVLDKVSFSIGEGEFVFLFGKTGCGKTTLLRLLKKELSPKGTLSGKIELFGKNIEELSLRESAEKIGFIMQDPENRIICDKVRSELVFYMENLGFSSEKIAIRLGEICTYFGINEWFDDNTYELSGGQKQILSLASVMTVLPELIILDEPISRLDPITASEFLTRLKKLNRETGVTVLICEHNPEEVFSMADKILYMQNGAVTHCGSPSDFCTMALTSEAEIFLPASVRLGREFCEEKPLLSVRDGRLFLSQNFNKAVASIEEKRFEKAIIKAESMYFRYGKGEKDVLKNASLTVMDGEILSIIGGNGAGKSTCLKVLAGILKPYHGKIKSGKKTVGYLPQEVGSVFLKDKIEDDFRLMGVPYQETVSKLAIGKLLSAHPNDLSGGEKQKCALAKIMLKKPDILLLDEPTKGLDVAEKNSFAEILKECRQEGMTIVLVTHDVEFAANVSDRCCLLFNGCFTPPTHPKRFFNGQFYSTSSSRMAKDVFENVATYYDLIALCRENRR